MTTPTTTTDTRDGHTLTDDDLTQITQRVLSGERLHRIGFDYHLTDTDVVALMRANNITVPAPSLTAPATRDEIIAERAEKGEDLTAIGKDYGMSRERARQIVGQTSTMPNADIREARRRYRDRVRAEATRAEQRRVRETADAHPTATIAELATLTGTTPGFVRDSLDWTERERRTDPQHYASIPEEDVLAEIRRVASLPNGEPLTGPFYDEHRDGGVSHARLLQKYGTWTAACEAAGVTPRQPNPGRTYTRNWTEAEMIGWVWAYLTSTTQPAYSRFEAWLREQEGAPSAQTIRNTVGPWIEMKRKAIEAHADATV